jgi:transcriptional regulator with XRE-family HTH domain
LVNQGAISGIFPDLRTGYHVIPYLVGVESDKAVHFGRFVAWKRLALGLSREEFGQRAGVSGRRMAAIEAMPEPGVFDTTFGGIAMALRMKPEELAEAWRREPVSTKFPRKPKGKRLRADDSAAARLLGGELVLLTELTAVAKERGVSLGELFTEISREWLATRTPFKGVHTGLDAIRQPPASARPPEASPASPGKPARARRGAGHAGQNGK